MLSGEGFGADNVYRARLRIGMEGRPVSVGRSRPHKKGSSVVSDPSPGGTGQVKSSDLVSVPVHFNRQVTCYYF
jgi:hypothetical protein